jgi:type II secretion system protein D
MNIYRSLARGILFLCCLLLLLLQPAVAQDDNAADGPGNSAEDKVDVQFPNTAIPQILLFYEMITGKKVIRDSNIQDKTLSVITSGELTYAEAADFIEKSFLLNGYAILPTENPDQLKIIAYNTDKKVTSEGVPVFTTPFELPESEQVVTYIMTLTYLTPDAAAEYFSNIVELHPYGKITPLQNANAVVITESASVIRRLVELRDHLDVSPVKTVSQSFQLERADSEEVVEALIDILDLDQEAASSTSSAPGQPANRAPRPAVNNDTAAPSSIPSQRGNGSFTKANAPKPRVRSIPRANRILVVASPQDLEYVSSIIEHLDAPVESASYMRRKLNYISVNNFLQIASDVILRGLGGENTQAGQISGSQNQSGGSNLGGQNGLTNNSIPVNNQSSFGNSNSSQRGGSTGALGSAGADQAAAPQSIVVDKTLLVADNVQNMLIASGPPEHLRLISELLDEMDCRPSQIQISAVIAQLNLGDDFDFGLDFLRSLDNLGNGNTPATAGSFASRPSSAQPLIDVATLTDVNNLIPAASGLTMYGQINNYTDVVLSALESTERFKVLSRPTIYTVNNRQATIETGQRVAVPRSTLSSLDVDQGNNNQVVTANIDFEDVVLRIDVLPLINADGEITLQIQQRNDDIIGSTVIGNDEIPTIGTQVLGTTVMVQDGATVLLGGLISEEDRKNETGVPLFSNLPLVGRVFGSTRDNVNRQELLIFIQPKIIVSPSEYEQKDQDMKDRTRLGAEAEAFAEAEVDNLDLFESQDFNSPEKRIHFFRDLFKKKPQEPSVRAVPISE